MKKYRLIITFILSSLFHTLLLLLFIQANKQSLKKGIGENPKIRLSSFEIASFDSQSGATMSNPQPTKIQKKKTPTPKNQNNTKIENIQREEKQQEKQQLSQIQESSPKEKQEQQEESDFIALEEMQNNFFQQTPQIPIEQSLNYQLADTQTKQNIHKFYGAEFGQLGLEEQEYILNNLAYIGRITQKYLRYPPNAGMLSQSGGNVIEFYLHPNGDISDLKIIKQSGFILLDRNSLKTIEIAYKDYPHPKTKTLIRFYINYYLR